MEAAPHPSHADALEERRTKSAVGEAARTRRRERKLRAIREGLERQAKHSDM